MLPSALSPLRSARSTTSCGVCFGAVTGAGAGLLPGWTISDAGMVGKLAESERCFRTYRHLATAKPTMTNTKIRNARNAGWLRIFTVTGELSIQPRMLAGRCASAPPRVRGAFSDSPNTVFVTRSRPVVRGWARTPLDRRWCGLRAPRRTLHDELPSEQEPRLLQKIGVERERTKQASVCWLITGSGSSEIR